MRRLVFVGVVAIGVLQLAAILTFFFFYPRYRTKTFREAQADSPANCEIELDQESATRQTHSGDVWLRDLDRTFAAAEYFRPNHPRKEKEFYLRVTRLSSRTDQYLVFLDRRGPEFDYFYVVNRSGRSTRFGSAFRAPDLRRLMTESGVK